MAVEMRGWIIGACVLLSAGAASAREGREPSPAPLRPGWYTMTLPEGVEVRILPPAVSFKDYPKVASRMGVEGTSLLRVQVDPSGKITSCTTERSAGLPELDEQACLLYRTRARFELRGATQPVTLFGPMQWILEDRE